LPGAARIAVPGVIGELALPRAILKKIGITGRHLNHTERRRIVELHRRLR